MAKTQKEGKRFEFSKIGTLLAGIADNNSLHIETDTSTKKEFIGTGIYIFNALLSKSILNGGILNNRITALCGESGVGKSFLAYNICREAQAKGYAVIYIDTEYSIEFDDLSAYGIETSPDKFKLVRSNKVEDIRATLAQLLNALKEEKKAGYEIDKFLIVLDSVGQLASSKEVNDAVEGKDKADMSRAKALKSLFRIINADLGYLKIPLLCTNHTYMEMSLFPKEIMSGGSGLLYSATTIVFLSKAKLKTGEEDETDLGASGIIVSAKSAKNRLSKPKKVKFEIDFSKGCNPYKGLEMFCTEQTFAKVGIAKGKMEVDKSTGEMTFKAGGNRWYVNHLGKSVATTQLHSASVFTQEVLEALDPIIQQFFGYKSLNEIEDVEKELMEAAGEDDFVELNLDDDSDLSDLVN